MKNVFIDTGILVDLIADRKPFSKHVIEIFNRAEAGEIQLFASSFSIASIRIMLGNFADDKKLNRILLDLLEYITPLPLDAGLLQRALRSGSTDFDLALQLISAGANGTIDVIITRSVNEYRDSEITVMAPDAFCLIQKRKE